MKEKWIKRCLTLAVLLLSLVSISTAACPHAVPELYKGQCGNNLVVSAPGILKNDIKDPGKTLQVVDPEDISIDPKLGTLDVNADGSFVFEASTDFAASGYVIFYYKATDGSCVSNQAYVKITVSCPCKAVAPEITVCQGTTVDEELLMSMGAKCSGCRDVTPVFDLKGVAEAPGTYPYKVSCPSRNIAEGHVTVRQPTPEVCDDGVDNDCDGLTDGGDDDCIPVSECQPAVCGGITQCDSNCGQMGGYCFLTTEGYGKCLGNWWCNELPFGCNSNKDCGDGVCVTGSCCGANVCVPTSDFCPTDTAPVKAEMLGMRTGPTGASLGDS